MPYWQVAESPKRRPPDLSLCRAKFAILSQCSVSCIGFLSSANNFKILLLTFKAIHELAPSYINNLVKIKPLNSRYRLRSNDRILLWHPNFKTLTSLAHHTFVASAPKLWNDFTSGNWNDQICWHFKKILKDRLSSKAFHSYLGLLNTYTRLCDFYFF